MNPSRPLLAACATIFCAGPVHAAEASPPPTVSIYGLIDMSFGRNIADAANGRKATLHSGGDDGSSQGNSTTRVGVKGSADLGGGFTGSFKLESNGITSGGEVNRPALGRQAWLGLRNHIGELRVGRQDSVVYQVMSDFDLNWQANSTSPYFNVGAGPHYTPRQSRAIQFQPDLGEGVTLRLGVVPANTADDTSNSVSVGGHYTMGPWVVGAAYESKRSSSAKPFKSAAARYNLGVATVSASVFDAGSESKGWGAGVEVPLGELSVGAQLANNTGLSIKGWELFARKPLLKSLYGYASVGHADKTVSYLYKGTAYAIGAIYLF